MSSTDALTYAPVPLLNGKRITTPTGEQVAARVLVTAIAEDGSERTEELEFRFGAWWGPADSTFQGEPEQI